MTRAWNAPIFALATVYLLIDGLFSYTTRPIAAWLGRQELLARVSQWISSLRPYPSLALFAVPVIILEPAKPISGYMIATGHFLAGAVIFIAAEVLKLTVVERLFHLNKAKLLTIPFFAWAYTYWRGMMDALEATKAWQSCRRIALDTAKWFRSRRSRLSLRAWHDSASFQRSRF